LPWPCRPRPGGRPPRFAFTDNGAESKGAFDQTLQQLGLTHSWTYPQSPRRNAYVERLHRALQESFVDFHEELLFTDCELFNRKLADWLVFYNAQRPHHTLGQRSPLHFLLQHQPERQRWWTHAAGCLQMLSVLKRHRLLS
jgi:transposase InsO family protein